MNNKLSAYLLLGVFFLGILATFDAESRLIRSGGRGQQEDSNAHDYLLVSNSFVNADNKLDGSFASGDSINSAGINSGLEKAYAVPRDCYQSFSSQEDYDMSVLYGAFVPGDCYYEFYLGTDTRLDFDGYVELLFPDASAVDVLWSLTHASLPSRTFSGTIDASNPNLLSLDIPMPSDLLAGNYLLSVGVTYWAGTNRSFFESLDSHNDSVSCNSDGSICQYDGFGSAQDNITFSSSTHAVNIYNGVAPQSVDEPRQYALMVIGLLFLFSQRAFRRR